MRWDAFFARAGKWTGALRHVAHHRPFTITGATLSIVAAAVLGASAVVLVIVAALSIALVAGAARSVPPATDLVFDERRLREEIERARRLEYTFALLRLRPVDLRPNVPDDPTVTAIRSAVRDTDAIIRHGTDLYLILPGAPESDATAARRRISDQLPDVGAISDTCSFAVFPTDGVTADGLLRACARGQNGAPPDHIKEAG